MRFSNKTIAELSRALGAAVRTNVEMDNLFLEHSLSTYDVLAGIKSRANALVRAALQLESPNNKRLLAGLSRYVLEKCPGDFPPVERLVHSLKVDGFEWRGGSLVPTTPLPAGLGNELSALEQDLQDLGFSVASTHYRQAHESFVAGNWEAANGQTRSFLESLLIELGNRITSTVRTSADAALQDLRNGAFIDASENQMLKGFWSSIQDNGPHQGLSNEQEALFRLHVATTVARYTIHRLRAAQAS